MRRILLSTWLLCGGPLLAGSTPAQGRVWIVDQSNGPGTSFTDLPPALKAAQDGDTVLVRTGNYSGGTITTGIRLLAEPGASVSVWRAASGTGLVVSGLNSSQTCVIQGLANSFAFPFMWPDAFLKVQGCQGHVHIDGVTLDARFAQSSFVTGIAILSCSHVTIHDTHIDQGLPLSVSAGTVLVTDSTLRGEHAFSGFGANMAAQPAILAFRSDLTLSRTNVTGGDGQLFVISPPGPAIDAGTFFSGDNRIRITGSEATTLGAGQNPLHGVSSAVNGTNNIIEVDPRVQLVPNPGAPAIAPGNTVTIERRPSMSASGAGPGGEVSADLLATAGDLAEIYLGLPFGPVVPPIPSWGPIWVDFGAVLVLGRFVVPPATETVALSFQLPPLAELQGAPITFQALAWTPPATLRFSSPATVVLN